MRFMNNYTAIFELQYILYRLGVMRGTCCGGQWTKDYARRYGAKIETQK